MTYHGLDAPETASAFEWAVVSNQTSGFSFDPAYGGTDDTRSDVLHPQVVFTETGTYVLQLKVKEDGVWVGSDKVEITVKPGVQVQISTAESLEVRESHDIYLPGDYDIELDGAVCLWSGGNFIWGDDLPDTDHSIEWTYSDTSITLSDPASINPTVTFPRTPGQYTLTLNLKNDDTEEVVNSGSITINVNHPNVIVVAAASASPKISAVDSQAQGHLFGVITGGEPDCVEWVQLAGPVSAQIAEPSELATTIAYPAAGDYTFGLLAKVGDEDKGYDVIGSDMLDVEVGYAQTVVSITADPAPSGSTGLITPYEDDGYVVNLYGSAEGPYDDLQWTGPAGVSFGGDSSPSSKMTTWATFPSEGYFELVLEALDNDPQPDTVIASTSVVVHVGSGAECELNAGPDTEYAIYPAFKQVVLSGLVKKDGTWGTTLPTGVTTTDWFCTNSGVSFLGHVEPMKETAEVPGPGKYTFGLVARDSSDNVVGLDYVDVVVDQIDSRVLASVSGSAYEKTMADELMPNRSFTLYGRVDGDMPGDPSYEWYLAGYKGQIPPEGTVTLENHNQANCQVRFADAGVYALVLEVSDSATLIGRDAVIFTIAYPSVIVDAWIEENGEPAGEYKVISDFSGNAVIFLNGSTTPSPEDGTTYEWVVYNGAKNGVTIQNPQLLGTTATFTRPGYYELALLGRSGSANLSWDIVKILVLPGAAYETANIVYAGRRVRPVFKYDDEPVAITLSDAFTVPDGTPVTWSADSSAVSFDDVDTINTVATFSQTGTYELTLTSVNSPNLEDTTIVKVYSADQFMVVEAGTYDDIKFPNALHLDQAWDLVADNSQTAYVNWFNPAEIYTYRKSYEWTVLNPRDIGVQFYPSPYALNPTVSFPEPGTYVLQLAVTVEDDSQEPHITTDEVIINVLEPNADTSAPTVTIDAEPESPDYSNASVSIRVEAIDTIDENVSGGHLQQIELILVNTSSQEEVVLKTVSGRPDYPTRLALQYALDMFSLPVGTYNVKARATDVAGQSTSANYKVGTSDYDFTVGSTDPVTEFGCSPQVITSQGEALEITASLVGQQTGTLKIFRKGTAEPIWAKSGGIQTSDTVIDEDVVQSDWQSGSHTIELAYGGSTFELPFNVVIDVDGSDITAEITNSDLEDGDGYNERTARFNSSNARLPVISTGLYELMGNAYHSDFEEIEYKIELFDGEVNVDHKPPSEWRKSYYAMVKNLTPGYTENGFCQGSVEGGLLGELDFSDVPNGIYQLLLTVRCNGVEACDTVRFVLDCPLKIGTVQFSQEDVIVSVGGMPLTIVRTYNSMNRRREGDFGYGWEFSIANMDVELNESRDDSFSDWTSRRGGDFDRDVTLTLPDGRRVTFVATYRPAGSNSWELRYDSPVGVRATLEPSESFKLVSGGGLGGVGYFWQVNGEDYVNDTSGDCSINLSYHDVPGWILTDEDGTKYHIGRKDYGTKSVNAAGEIDVEEGGFYSFRAYGPPYLDYITTPSGDKVVLDLVDEKSAQVAAVKHYLAGVDPMVQPDNFTKSLKLVRDGQGRVIEVYPPSELDAAGDKMPDAVPHVKYIYDPYYGNLIEVRKLVDRAATTEDDRYSSTFYYYGDHPDATEPCCFGPEDHYITDIEDERGLAPIRYEYDYEGRLVATIDAKGNRIVLQHGDEEGRYDSDQIEVVFERGDSEDGQQQHLTVYYYDTRGNVVKVDKYANGTLYSSTEYEYKNTSDEHRDKPTKTRQSVDLDAQGHFVYAETEMIYKTGSYEGKSVDVEETTDPAGIKTISYFDRGNHNLLWSRQFKHVDPDDFDSAYEEVSTQRNTYDETGLLKTSETLDGSKRQQFAANVYDNHNRLTHTVQVDCQAVTDFEPLYDLTVQGLSDLTGDDYIVTAYLYNESNSGSADQPYRVTDPYHPDDVTDPASPFGEVMSRYFLYDDDNRQIESGYDFSVDDYHFKRVRTLTTYDAMGRTVETHRVVDPYNLVGDDWVLDDQNVQTTLLSTTTYDAIGKVDTTTDENGIVTK